MGKCGPRGQSRQAGFSLVELLMVLSIVLVVAAIAIPNMLTTLESYRLDSAARMLSGRMTDARIQAVKLNQPTWVAVDVTNRRVQVQTFDRAAPGNVINLGSAETLPNGVVFAAAPAQIVFDSLGRPASVPAPPPHLLRLRVARSGQEKRIVVTPSGKIDVS